MLQIFSLISLPPTPKMSPPPPASPAPPETSRSVPRSATSVASRHVPRSSEHSSSLRSLCMIGILPSLVPRLGPLLARQASCLDGWLRHLWRSATSCLTGWCDDRPPRSSVALSSYVDPFGTASQVLRTQVGRECRSRVHSSPSISIHVAFTPHVHMSSDRQVLILRTFLSMTCVHSSFTGCIILFFIHVGLRPSRLRLLFFLFS